MTLAKRKDSFFICKQRQLKLEAPLELRSDGRVLGLWGLRLLNLFRDTACFTSALVRQISLTS